MNKGASLRRSGVSIRSAADEEKAKKGDEANTPGTSSHEGSKVRGTGESKSGDKTCIDGLRGPKEKEKADAGKQR